MLKGWTGPSCLTSTDECSSNPCYNNATCIDGHNSYTCTCQPGYTGKYWNKDCFVVIVYYIPMTFIANTSVDTFSNIWCWEV